MTELHRCEPGYDQEKEEYVFQYGGYGPAIEYCTEDEKGRLWCGNSEYKTQVNFCPFCGCKAPHGMVDTQVQAIKSLLREVIEELSVYDDFRIDFSSKYAVLRRGRTVLGEEFPKNVYCGKDDD